MKNFLVLLSVFCLFILIFPTLFTRKDAPRSSFSFETRKAANDMYYPEQLTLEKIFGEHQWEATLSADKKVTLVATGDVIPGRMVNAKTLERNDFKWPWQKTSELLKNADLTLINLEAPILSKCPIITSGFTFCGNAGHVDGMVFAGVDLANLVNNHVANFGQEGILETKNILAGKNIDSYASGEIFYRTIKNIKFAFLGFNDIGYFVTDKDLDLVKTARAGADVVVVSVHWGIEYQALPDKRQIELAHKIIDNGADVIIGNHPHWIQPVEFYKDRLITYAHGNFIFDQEWSERTKLGVVGKYTFYEKHLINVEFFPVKIVDFGQPYLMAEEDRKKILNEMETNSRKNLK